jgi:DNA-binding NarL/FixJ family response regulator
LRKDILSKMGFTSYEAYLKSPTWHHIKQRVYEHKGRTQIPNTENKVYRMYDSGIKQKEIAKELNLSKSCISQIISRRKLSAGTVSGLPPTPDSLRT